MSALPADLVATAGVSAPEAEAAPFGGAGLIYGLLRTARPKQWSKNLLVFAAPAAAGVMSDGDVLLRGALAFIAFSLLAGSTYFWNDVQDVDADRLHPRKRLRPVAAGIVPLALARRLCPILFLIGLGVGALAGDLRLVGILTLYVGLTVAYSSWLKHVAVVDLAIVASGFLVRSVAGGLAAGVPMSQWFLIVSAFGALFVVAGKRHAEFLSLGDGRALHRATLGEYPLTFLSQVRSLSAAVAIGAYCLWAFERGAASAVPLWFELSIAPFVVAFLRYALVLETGLGGAPEDVILGDRAIQVLGATWVLLLMLGIYVGA